MGGGYCSCGSLRSAGTLSRFRDPLPVPREKKPFYRSRGKSYYSLTMSQFRQSLHSELPETAVWGFDGTYPGPTIRVKEGELVFVQWNNALPEHHLLPVDHTVHGAGTGVPVVRTVTHVHGASVHPDSDGYPEAWFTKNFEQTGPFFTRKIYRYENRQQPCTLWYHDHALGITRLNVYAGLAGFYLIEPGSKDRRFNLPSGEYDIPLLIQDRSFNVDGSLYYTAQKGSPVEGPETTVVDMFFGDTNLVNGKVWPYLEVKPRKYRFRLLNGANSRVYTLYLDTGQPMYQIATDSGYREKPALLRNLTLAPAERAEVIVDFANMEGSQVVLRNSAPAPFPAGPLPDESTGTVMAFRVKGDPGGIDHFSIPEELNKVPPVSINDVCRTRYLTLDSAADRFGRDLMLLNKLTWDDPVTELPVLGTSEIWFFINLTGHTHPIHLHLVDFQITGRRAIDTEWFKEKGELKYTGPTQPADREEEGWKDTVRANPGEVTGVKARFVPFSGLFVWHCHILEHEDYEMMRPFIVIRPEENP
ncbi:multicopper oxidase family protein [Alteribacter natronophilus]|uniref:multicopper oxidase family protein n=1 Tax=Alteribacter natronophilus TaxID=2583810 RepID=UPI001FE27307